MINNCQEVTKDDVKVYVIVHELFGIYVGKKSISLLPPKVPPCKDKNGNLHEHKYVIGRFKDGKWGTDGLLMSPEGMYSFKGLMPRKEVATAIPCHLEFSPHPRGAFALSKVKPFCSWILPIPKFIHQLRVVRTPESSRPLFIGDPHGDAIDAQLDAIAIVQAFEYLKNPKEDLKIILNLNGSKTPVKLDYNPDTATKTINIHLWAQLEDESGMDDSMADMHAGIATNALVALFDGLHVCGGARSLSIDDHSTSQLLMPPGIRFPELMTLGEKFLLKGSHTILDVECTARTCGHGGTLFVSAP